MPELMRKSAVISEDGIYRYQLRRQWKPKGEGSGWVNFVGLNPSKADADYDDPTVRKMMGFAQRWGYGGMIVTNLLAFRSTDPLRMLYVAQADLPMTVGPENDKHLVYAAGKASKIVVCWGMNAGQVPELGPRRAEVLRLLRGERDRPLLCLGTTRGHYPKHPVRLAYSTPLEEYPWQT